MLRTSLFIVHIKTTVRYFNGIAICIHCIKIKRTRHDLIDGIQMRDR